MNRITTAIDRKTAEIAQRLEDGIVTQEKVDACHSSLDMSFEEFCKFQTLKTLAMADGKLSEEEAQTVYALLGNVPSVFNAQPVAAKAVLTGLFRELLESAIVRRQHAMA